DLANDDDIVNVDLARLQIPASNRLELLRLPPSYSGDQLQDYYERCSQACDQLLHQPMVGFAMFPLHQEVEFVINYDQTVFNINLDVFRANLETDHFYLCFSTADTNFVFCLSQDRFDQELTENTVAILKLVLESRRTQKAVFGVAIMSGVLCRRFGIE